MKSELTGTNTSIGGLKPSEGANSRFLVLGCHKNRVDWYKHQQRGLKPSGGPITDVCFWVVIASNLSGTYINSGGLKPSDGPNSRFMVLGCGAGVGYRSWGRVCTKFEPGPGVVVPYMNFTKQADTACALLALQ